MAGGRRGGKDMKTLLRLRKEDSDDFDTSVEEEHLAAALIGLVTRVIYCQKRYMEGAVTS